MSLDSVLRWVRESVIGHDAIVPGPFGPHPKRYFDQTASGLPFGPIEDTLRQEVLPWMANTHTEASATGRFMTAQVERAHRRVRDAVRAREDDVVIFTGSGATGAVNKLIGCLGIRVPDTLRQWVTIPEDERPLVVRSMMEHHSNDIPWRETIARSEFVDFDSKGRPCPRDLERILRKPEHRDRKLLIGTFSAASNVTGIRTDCDALARVMHEHGGYALFDFAACGPYVDIDLHPGADDSARKDAIFISIHKFLGGPQTPGLLVVNRRLIRTQSPVEPGGGTVLYTSPWNHRYLEDLQHREEGGTPPIVQIIRAGLVFDLKDALGVERIQQVEEDYVHRAIARWRHHARIRILGDLDAQRIGIVSLILDGGRLHHHLAVRLLSDLFGIQVRGGCMCAGTYGHALLGIDEDHSLQIRCALDRGEAGAKPGWVRVSFGPTTREDDFQVLLDAVETVADRWQDYAPQYRMDPDTAEWRHHEHEPRVPIVTLRAGTDAPPRQPSFAGSSPP
jgi:selenocysteine lyase/cysteine desulfurase